MKKRFLPVPLLLLLLLTGCAGLPRNGTFTVYSRLSRAEKIFPAGISLEPKTALSGLEEELPETLKSLLCEAGFTAADSTEEAGAVLEVLLHRKGYVCDYRSCESVTVSMRLHKDGRTFAYLMMTEDTDRSMASFGWTVSLIKKSLHRLAEVLDD